jgi:hypothetical protein
VKFTDILELVGPLLFFLFRSHLAFELAANKQGGEMSKHIKRRNNSSEQFLCRLMKANADY